MNQSITEISQTCYICFDKVENIVSVCECNKICHLKCLHQWLIASKTDTCDICKKKYIDLTQYFKEKSHVKVSILITVILMTICILCVGGGILYVIIDNVTKPYSRAFCIIGTLLLVAYLLSNVINYHKKHKNIIVTIMNQFENTESVNTFANDPTVINVNLCENHDDKTENTPLI
jgi:hypothetical protein